MTLRNLTTQHTFECSRFNFRNILIDIDHACTHMLMHTSLRIRTLTIVALFCGSAAKSLNCCTTFRTSIINLLHSLQGTFVRVLKLTATKKPVSKLVGGKYRSV